MMTSQPPSPVKWRDWIIPVVEILRICSIDLYKSTDLSMHVADPGCDQQYGNHPRREWGDKAFQPPCEIEWQKSDKDETAGSEQSQVSDADTEQNCIYG